MMAAGSSLTFVARDECPRELPVDEAADALETVRGKLASSNVQGVLIQGAFSREGVSQEYYHNK
jgi:hypothetical protein